jgi:hypothetical protein
MMLRTMRILPLALLFLCTAAPASAQSATDALYLHGRVKELPEKKSGKLDASDAEALQFTWEKGTWRVPFAQIRTVYVSLSRRTAWTELDIIAGAVAGAAQKRKVLLSLNLTDEQGRRRNCVFYLPSLPAGEFLRVLETKTGRKAIFESAEARQALEGEKK